MDVHSRHTQGKGSQFKKKWEAMSGEVIEAQAHRCRWHNHLDPMVRKSPWNETEEYVFIDSHKVFGNKWAEIAKMIPGRYIYMIL